MARTKQTARKPCQYTPRQIYQFPDHTGQTYTVVDPSGCDAITKLSVHLYSLGPLTVSSEDVGELLLRSRPFTDWGNARNKWPRVDVYPPLASIEACIEHHQREKVHRQNAKLELHRQVAASAGEDGDDAQEAVAKLRGREPLPHIVPTWCCSGKFWVDRYTSMQRYRSFILVVPEDCASWGDVERTGLWVVKFDQDVTDEMQLSVDDARLLDESDSGGPEEWVVAHKRAFGPPVCIQRLMLSQTELIESRGGGYDHDFFNLPSTLMDEWIHLTQVFWDCTYSKPCCDGCDEGERHDDCELDLTEHVFDEDGQCLECRRFLDSTG
ncbi:hypothetical protein FE257_009736 [Aspergillus nanangensis]|uniref:Uncharacterized protein n=1 Tax=Aspergillus nanangensis TaxID=2582783 RepID=A0AAD4CKW6_ASPNN|nr:hypothetical protein FE257_009736 [Aspergillus nanangensis]